MRIGLIYPQTEFGDDPAAIRDYAQTAEGLGYTHITAYDHILGANPQRPGGWSGPYTFEQSFIEPFVLFAYLAGLTNRIEFASGVIILPQRQTALVAKQAATLDVLCGGRLRLGVGLGWNAVEYQALNEKFSNRARRIEEQVAVLRALWTQPLVKFAGKYHQIDDAGLNPMPVQRPIPLWFGGNAPEALARAARLADGWMPGPPTAAGAAAQLDLIRRTLEQHGRDPARFGIEARIPYAAGAAVWETSVAGWEAAGATHISLNTMGAGLRGPAAHIAAMREFARTAGLG
jgi:probable F420-dependent oxidoreductase